jgi:hypothetical protein
VPKIQQLARRYRKCLSLPEFFYARALTRQIWAALAVTARVFLAFFAGVLIYAQAL